MSQIQCVKCLETDTGFDKAPYPGALGEQVKKSVCQKCWQAWGKFSVNVINDYKLKPFLPEHRTVVETNMKRYLNLDGAGSGPALSQITLDGQQGKQVTFNSK